LNVVILTDYAYVNGGAGKVALESALALTKAVDHVYLFTAVGEIPESLKTVENLSVTSLGQHKVTEMPMIEAITKGLWNREAEQKFSELLSKLSPADTVIHLHSWRDALTVSPLTMAIKMGFKVVVTCHDFGVACPLAGFFDERHRKVCHERGLGMGCLTKSCTAGSYVKKSWFVARHAIQAGRGRTPSAIKHFIFVSSFSAQVLDTYLPETAKRHFVRNPISVPQQARANPAGSNSLVFVGRFSPEKGPDVAALAAYKTKTHIRFVGTGSLPEKIRELNPDAELMGWRSPSEVAEIVRGARALVFPSIWYETQGMVVDEAAANGVPAIVSDCTAAVDTVTRLGSGLTFPAGSVEGLVDRINQLKSDELVEKLSKSGYDSYWASPPTMDAHLEELLKVYSEVLAD
jgi:glycosyltransferase involved in cell wall biosynthesis